MVKNLWKQAWIRTSWEQAQAAEIVRASLYRLRPEMEQEAKMVWDDLWGSSSVPIQDPKHKERQLQYEEHGRLERTLRHLAEMTSSNYARSREKAAADLGADLLSLDREIEYLRLSLPGGLPLRERTELPPILDAEEIASLWTDDVPTREAYVWLIIQAVAQEELPVRGQSGVARPVDYPKLTRNPYSPLRQTSVDKTGGKVTVRPGNIGTTIPMIDRNAFRAWLEDQGEWPLTGCKLSNWWQTDPSSSGSTDPAPESPLRTIPKMDKQTYDRFHALLLGLPGWRHPRRRSAFITEALWNHPILDELNLAGGPSEIATDLLDLCRSLDTPTEDGLSPSCALLAEIRKTVGTGGQRDAVIEELTARLCEPAESCADTRDQAIPSVLFLAAEPGNAARIRLNAEYRTIDEELCRAKHRDRVRLLPPLLAVRPADLNRAMQEHRADIVHFSGHGSGFRGIYLEDDAGKAKLASTAALSALFRPLAGRTRAVILNACSTAAQAQVIARDVDFAMGTCDKITDAAATAFSIGFYQALGAQGSLDIKAAFRAGCTLIQLEGIAGHNIPVLHRKDGAPITCAD